LHFDRGSCSLTLEKDFGNSMARYAGGGKRTVETTPSLDIGAIKRAGIFASFEERQLRAWDVDSSIADLAPFEWNGHQLVVRDQPIRVSRMPCPLEVNVSFLSAVADDGS
jgi:hypothetical protein